MSNAWVVVLVLVGAACGPTAAAPGTPDAAVVVSADAGPPDAAGHPDAHVCVPTSPPTEVCDGVDNDCNGKVDDVDIGGDGIYDCQKIVLFGNAGARPSSNFVAWLESNGSNVERVQTDDTPLSDAMLAQYDVILLDDLVRAYTAAEAHMLNNWVAGGGGLMVMSGYTGGQTDLDRPNSLLTEIGLEYVPGLQSGPVTMFVTHPITTGLTSVTFSGGFLVQVVPGVNAGTNLAVAHLNGGEAGIVQDRGEFQGRVFVWGDEWITFDSEWSTMPEIPELWVDILGWLEHFR